MRQRSSALVIALLMIVSGCALFIGPSLQNVRADATPDHYWKGTTSTDPTVAENWQPAAIPATGDNIYFSALSSANCIWTLTGSYGSFNLLSNFTKTVVQASSFSVTSLSILHAQFTGSTSHILTCSGSVNIPAVTITSNVLCITMTGDGSTFCGNGYFLFYTLKVSANITQTGTDTSVERLIVDSGKTLTLQAGKTFYLESYSSIDAYINNDGTIAGSGTLNCYDYSTTITGHFGVISCPVIMDLPNGISSKSVTLTGDFLSSNTLVVRAGTGVGVITLDCSASNYALSASDITILTRGVINGRGSVITCSGSWDSSAGTFTAGASTLIMSGTSKILTLAASQKPYNLQVTGSTALAQDTNVTNLFTLSGSLSQNGYWLYYYGDTLNLMGGSWNGNINLTGANAHTVAFTGPMPSYIYAKTKTTFTNGTQGSLNVTPSVGIYGAIKVSRIHKTDAIPTYALRFQYALSSGTATFDAGLTAHWYYDVYIDGTKNQSAVQANAAGWVSWSYSDWTTRFFNVTSITNAFTSSPNTSAIANAFYDYPVTYLTNDPSTSLSMTTTAYWLVLNGNQVQGSPTGNNVGGIYTINLTLSNATTTVWQNFSLSVSPPAGTLTDVQVFGVIMGLVFGFGLIVLSVIDKRHSIWSVFAGLAWFMIAIVAFYPVGLGWMLLGIGIGLIMWVEGAMDYASGRQKK